MSKRGKVIPADELPQDIELFPFEETFFSSSSSDHEYYPKPPGPVRTLPKYETTNDDEDAEEATGTKEDEIFDKWNPMAEDYLSIQNLINVDQESPGAFALGVKDKPKTIGELPCPFFVEASGFCWKGRHCKMRHDNTPITDLGKEIILITYSLVDKPRLTFGMCTYVSVQYVVSPSEFYVIPFSLPKCLCTIPFSSLKKNPKELDELKSGLGAFKEVSEKLNSTMETNMFWRKLQSVSFVPNQLVAVKIAEGKGQRQWFRGEIIKSTPSANGRSLPWHVVYLIDVGKTLDIRGDDVCKMPSSMSRIPALAFKCCLNGVVPVWKSWTTTGIETFNQLVSNRFLRMTVEKRHPFHGICKTFEMKPYLVKLTFTVEDSPKCSPPVLKKLPDEPYFDDLLEPAIESIKNRTPPWKIYSVSELLAEEGLALKFNEFPYRPSLNKAFTNREQFISPLNIKQLNDSTIIEEFDRLAYYCELLKENYFDYEKEKVDTKNFKSHSV